MATDRSFRTLLLALVLVAGCPAAAQAGDPVFTIEFNDGKVTPNRLDVPANVRIELQLSNVGKTPAEFESTKLRKEKVLAADSKSSMVIKGLAPGEYEFFDDFHPDTPPAVLVAR
ncbi:MAG: cupredoxin domain-containing protein [Ancalomicrobiaceae bacterium]|nr:cupredoxin domain-containing protein [Ancalomicrobiaceae bacterium]